jgi:hypothetical protein
LAALVARGLRTRFSAVSPESGVLSDKCEFLASCERPRNAGGMGRGGVFRRVRRAWIRQTTRRVGQKLAPYAWPRQAMSARAAGRPGAIQVGGSGHCRDVLHADPATAAPTATSHWPERRIRAPCRSSVPAAPCRRRRSGWPAPGRP